MKRIEKTIKIFHNFKEQEEADLEYWNNVSGEEKLRVVEEMRAQYIRLFYPEIKGIKKVVRIRKLGED